MQAHRETASQDPTWSLLEFHFGAQSQTHAISEPESEELGTWECHFSCDHRGCLMSYPAASSIRTHTVSRTFLPEPLLSQSEQRPFPVPSNSDGFTRHGWIRAPARTGMRISSLTSSDPGCRDGFVIRATPPSRQTGDPKA